MRFVFKVIVVFFALFSVNLKGQSVGGVTTGGNVFKCDTINSGFISLTSYTGTILHWQTSINNGATWMFNPNNTNLFSYNNLKQKTSFRAVVKLGSFAPDTSTISEVTVYPAAKGGTITTPTTNFCNNSGSFVLNLNGFSSSVQYWQTSNNNGNTWSTLSFTNSTIALPSINVTTWYRSIVLDNPSCPTDTSLVLQINVVPPTNAGSVLTSTTVCKNFNNGKLQLQGNNGTIVKWISSTNNGLSWTTITNVTDSNLYNNIPQTTIYAAIVKNGVCPSDTSFTAKVTTLDAVQANAGPDKEINLFESIQLDGVPNGQASWTPTITLSDGTIFTPIATPAISTIYVLTQKDNQNCISKDSVFVKVIIPIPSGITPNNDGVNDVFQIDKIESFTNNKLLIFNKWGNIVFKAEPYLNDWIGKTNTGKDLPDDTYFYIVDYGNGDKPVNGYVIIKR